ncbi:MAG: preprotein translocase subunit SecE [Chloroflexi bacterium]|nr:preprotein translocase subunit SecE [Chloroflexota bacterium]MCH9009454.1 preprotein translocase subunit SecE [Chloroflexota bacterium]
MARNPGIPRRLGTGVVRRALTLRYFGDIVSELRRVTWPTRQETYRLTVMVIMVAATIGLFLGLVDMVFSRLIGVILGK